jgi:hypothetical protein
MGRLVQEPSSFGRVGWPVTIPAGLQALAHALNLLNFQPMSAKNSSKTKNE